MNENHCFNTIQQSRCQFIFNVISLCTHYFWGVQTWLGLLWPFRLYVTGYCLYSGEVGLTAEPREQMEHLNFSSASLIQQLIQTHDETSWRGFFVCWSTYFPLKSAQSPQALFHLLLFPLTITSPYLSLRLINHNPLGVFRHKLYPWPRANFTLSHQSKMILHRVSFSLFPPDSHHFHYSLTTCFIFCFFCNPQDKNKQQHNSLLDICLLATTRWFVLDTECR